MQSKWHHRKVKIRLNRVQCLEPISKFNFPDMRSVYVGPAPRREDVWPEIRPEALFFPGEAPVLPVFTRPASGRGER